MVDHPGIAKIAFTGSTAVGREIGAKAGQMLKRVTLELGGKSPNIILPDADLKAAIKGSFMGIYFNTGQACNAGSRLFVHKDQYDEVVSALAEAAKGARVGPGLDKSTQFGPVVSQEQYERVMSYIESGQEQGAEAVVGGNGDGKVDGSGYFINPTLFTNVSDDMKIAREEIFGPVLVAMPYEDLEEVARRANDTEYGLAAGRLDPRRRERAQDGQAAQGRERLHQRVRAGRPRRPVRWLQGVRHRPRDGPREPGRLSRAENGLDEPYLRATPGRLSDWRIGPVAA